MSVNATIQPQLDKLTGNPNIKPGDDYYHHICQSWLTAHPRPANRAEWGQFSWLAEKVHQQVEAILQDWQQIPAKQQPASQKQVLDLYQVYLNKDQYSQAGCQTLIDIYQSTVGQLRADNLALILARLTRLGSLTPWSFAVGVDIRFNQRHCLFLDQAGLSLPDRDYYIDKSARIKKIRSNYWRFIGSFSRDFAKELKAHQSVINHQSDLKPALELLYQDLTKRLGFRRAVFELEVKIARLSWPLAKVYDTEKTYNPYTKAKLKADFDFDWETYFKELGGHHPSRIVVSQPDYLATVIAILKSVEIDQLRAYLTWHLIDAYGVGLNEKLMEKYFHFFGRQLHGQATRKSLPYRALQFTNRNLQDVIGQEYVRRYYPISHQRAVVDLADQVQKSLTKRLAKVPWMTPKSRNYAQSKLKTIIVNLGRPATWFQYDNLKIEPDNYIATLKNLADFANQSAWKQLRQKPNRRNFNDCGGNGVQIVNAWTDPTLRNTNYPAAILQPPFYDQRADLVANLGAIGSIIGHELIHNFDSTGVKYDLEGHLNPWLSKAEKSNYHKLIKPLIALSSQHEIVKGVNMKGELVVNELLSDLAGLQIVVDIVVRNHPDLAERKVALRRLFAAYAYYHARHITDELRILRAKSDPHPDIIFRVNGVLPHIDEFYEAYSLAPTDKLYLKPEQRVKAW